MDSRTKIGISVYALIYAAAAVAAFRLEGLVPVPTIYILLSALYVIPIWLGITGRLSVRLGALLLVGTPLLPALIVVDPLEVGFYGYDPYWTLRDAMVFQSDGPIRLAREQFAWPGFYGFLWVVTSIVSLPVETVGKYLPLIAVLTPLFVYLFARRLLDHRTAFVAAMGFAGVRTLYTFQVKFIDETPAFVLFFALLLVLLITSESRRRTATAALTLLVALGTILTHHYVGALVVVLLVLWDLSRWEFGVPAGLRDLSWPVSRRTTVTGLVFVAMFLVVAPQFVGFLTSIADLSPGVEIESGQTPEQFGGGDDGQVQPGEGIGGGGAAGAGSADSLRFRQLLAANLVLLGILSIVVLGARHWIVEAHPALLVVGAFGGLLAVGYGYSVLFGPVIPLDPSRYLLYMTGLLLVAAGYVLDRVDLIHRPRTLFSTLVALLVVSQVVLLPPAVLYSDQAETIVGEDHYSPSQFAASEWVAEYDGEQVVGWEGGLWLANGIRQLGYGTEVDCSVLRVWRVDAPSTPERPTDTEVYANGRMRLSRCPV